MSTTKVSKENRVIKVISPAEQKSYLSESDAEMDLRAVQAVKAVVSKANVCKEPVAKYDLKTKKAFLEYPDGRKVNVK